MELDELKLIRGGNYNLDGIEVIHPTLGQITDLGLTTYLEYVSVFTTGINDWADVLFCEADIWYEDLESDWKLFLEREAIRGIPVLVETQAGIVEGVKVSDALKDAINFIFSKSSNSEYVFTIRSNEGEETDTFLCEAELQNQRYVLKEGSFRFTKDLYNKLSLYLCKINWIKKKYDFLKGGNKTAKKMILRNAYNQRKRQKKKEFFTFESMISSVIAKGVPYKDIWDYPIFFVYDQFYRYTKIEDYQNTMSALYAGGIDTDKNPIKWEEINWSSVIKD